jgi:hypothetical protein
VELERQDFKDCFCDLTSSSIVNDVVDDQSKNESSVDTEDASTTQKSTTGLECETESLLFQTRFLRSEQASLIKNDPSQPLKPCSVPQNELDKMTSQQSAGKRYSKVALDFVSNGEELNWEDSSEIGTLPRGFRFDHHIGSTDLQRKDSISEFIRKTLVPPAVPGQPKHSIDEWSSNSTPIAETNMHSLDWMSVASSDSCDISPPNYNAKRPILRQHSLGDGVPLQSSERSKSLIFELKALEAPL